jgi:cutinase
MLGRAVARELKKVLPDVAVEGVNYSAGVGGNMTPQGADAQGIKMASDLFKSAAAKCPQAALLGGGYSQGAALQHRAVEALPKNVQVIYPRVEHYVYAGSLLDAAECPF